MENNENHENIANENASDNNTIKENNSSDNVNQNMKKTSSNNDLEDEGKEADITGQILFRRIMGKKLCSVTLLNEEQNIIIGASIHDPEIIPKLKIGDMINIKGRIYFHRNNPKNKNIQAETIKLLGKGPGAEKINEKRKYFIDNKNILTNYDTLC
jgi:lysyl-tRNA synthetase class II